MADKRGYNLKTFAEARFNVGGDVIKAPPTYDAESLRSVSFTMEDWHVENGWPVPGAGAAREVVGYDITPTPTVTPQPEDVELNADARWIARDYNGGSWPAFSGNTNAAWTGTGTKTDSYTYITDEIRYTVPGIRLDPDDQDYFAVDLSALSGDTYTAIVVFKPYPGESQEDEDDEDATYGLWAPASPGTGQPELRVRNDKIFIKQSSELAAVEAWKAPSNKMTFSYFLRRQRPTYMVFTAGPERFRSYFGTSPTSLRMYGKNDVHDLPKDYRFRLGSYASDTNHTANMTVFDVAFYNQSLTPVQFVSELQLLAAAYGGNYS